MYHGSLAQVSNREDLELLYQIADDDTGDAIDLSAATIVFLITDPDSCRDVINGSTTDGKITLPETTTFRIFIPRSEMTALCQRNYEVGLTVENAGVTKQFIVGTLPVLDGIVSK